MDPIKVPTDNMYKVLALGGIAMIISSLVWGYAQLKAERDYSAPFRDRFTPTMTTITGSEPQILSFWAEPKTRRRVEAKGTKSTELLDNYTSFAEQYALLRFAITRKTIRAALADLDRRDDLIAFGVPESQFTSPTDAFINETYLSLTSRVAAGQLAAYQLILDYRVIKASESDMDVTAIVLNLAFIVGLIGAVTGFVLWFIRLQRYDDLIKQKEATNRTVTVSDYV